MPASESKKATMAQKMAFRAAVRKAAVDWAKRTSAYEVAKRLGVSKRIVEFWASGSWPSYTTSLRLAPLLGVKVP